MWFEIVTTLPCNVNGAYNSPLLVLKEKILEDLSLNLSEGS